MGFTPYSKPVEPAKWVDPMDLNLYAKSMMYKQELADKNMQDLSTAYNSLFSIDAYGPDKRRLSELENEFRQEVSGMNFSDLSNMQTMNQIKNIIRKFGSNKDALAISQRSAFKAQEEKKMEEARKKGRTYSNRNYDRMMNYFNGEDYMETPKNFNLSSGYLVPEIQKKQDAITKAATRQATELGPDGRIRTYNKVDGERAQKLWAQAISNDPELIRYYSDRFEDEYDGTDWDLKGKEMLTQARNTALELAASSQGSEKAEYEAKAKRYDQAINSNYAGSRMKEIAFQEFLDDDANNYGNTINAYDLKDIKADQFALEDKRYNQRLQFEREKQKIEQEAAIPGVSQIKNPLRRSLIAKASGLGIDPTDSSKPDGFMTDQELTKKIAEKVAEKKKEEQTGQGESRATKITLDGEDYDKKTLKESFDRRDTKTIEDAINEILTIQGKEKIDPQWFGENIKYVEENGKLYAEYESDDYFGGEMFRIAVDDIKKWIDDPNYNVSMYSESDDFQKPTNASAETKVTETEVPSGTKEEWLDAGWTEEQIKEGLKQGKIKVNE